MMMTTQTSRVTEYQKILPLSAPLFFRTTACQDGDIYRQSADEYVDRPAICCSDDVAYTTPSLVLDTPINFHAAVAACKGQGAHLCSKHELYDLIDYLSDFPNKGSIPNCSDGDTIFLWTCTAGPSGGASWKASCSSHAECCSGLCGADNFCFYWAKGHDDKCVIQ